LHYAAFKGYIEILDYLEGTGADQEIKTKSGLNVLHLSAQGDQIKSFVFYQNKISLTVWTNAKVPHSTGPLSVAAKK
jgi:ankyrin repeat protein